MNSSLLPLADAPGEIIPIVAVIFFFLIPIVAIMAWHQQRMAMLVRNNAPEQLNNAHLPPLPNQQMAPNDVAVIRQEIQQLKDIVNSLAINVDNLNDKVTRQGDISSRMRVGD